MPVYYRVPKHYLYFSLPTLTARNWAIAAVLMLGIPYAGIQYFKSQGIWHDSEGNPHADIWGEEYGRSPTSLLNVREFLNYFLSHDDPQAVSDPFQVPLKTAKFNLGPLISLHI
ncbi:hypothetical protein H6G00_01085 [Leptolyngbya sp. FACHB-541]|uniref:hypothetical protein n=1 Tax=Leptolyngbya sp. FACHB-541 TaxID=2692810 RepID=UPI0016847842|nr:hypothetical protein [Leptolyngbya sp. FACHB-541]MBD1995223.1 hypothetical protein [Leptolyngbya sp. FACHB-541]